MDLIKTIKEGNFSALKDHVSDRIASITSDKILTAKNTFIAKARGLTLEEYETSLEELSEHRGSPAKEDEKINIFYDLIPGDLKGQRDLRKMSNQQYVSMAGDLESLTVQELRSNISKLKALKDKVKGENDEFMSANLKILTKLYNEALQNKLKDITEALDEISDVDESKKNEDGKLEKEDANKEKATTEKDKEKQAAVA